MRSSVSTTSWRPLSRERVHHAAPLSFLREHEVAVIQRAHGFEIPPRCDVRCVDAETVQPRRLASIAAVFQNEWATSAVVAVADDHVLGADQEVPEGLRRFDEEYVAAMSRQIQAQVSDIHVALARSGLRVREQLRDVFA